MCLQYNLGSDGRRERTASQGASWVKGNNRQRRHSSLLWVLGEFMSSWWNNSIVCKMNFIGCLFSRCFQCLPADGAFPSPSTILWRDIRDAAVGGLSFLHFKCWSPHSKSDGIGSWFFRRWLGLEEVLMVEHHDEEKDTNATAPSFTKWGYKM